MGRSVRRRARGDSRKSARSQDLMGEHAKRQKELHGGIICKLNEMYNIQRFPLFQKQKVIWSGDVYEGRVICACVLLLVSSAFVRVTRKVFFMSKACEGVLLKNTLFDRECKCAGNLFERMTSVVMCLFQNGL